MEQDQASKGDVESIQTHNDRCVSWSIVLVKQHTFTEFPTVLDLNIFS